MTENTFNSKQETQESFNASNATVTLGNMEVQMDVDTLKKLFFISILQKNYNLTHDIIFKGNIKADVTGNDGKNAINYLVENLESKYLLDSAQAGECCLTNKSVEGHQDTLQLIDELLQKDVKPDLRALCVVARRGHSKLVSEFLAHADIDVTEKINGKTVREIALEAGYPECAELLNAKENTQSIALARQNNVLLKENNALLKQILKNQEQDRLERVANMERTRNLLWCMMSYMECLGSTNSSFSHRSAIMDKFHSHLYSSPRPRN